MKKGWAERIRKEKAAQEEYAALLQNVENTMSKYSKFGASDSEPDGQLQLSMWRAMIYGKVEVPKSGRAWELFTASMKCGEAARALTKVARALCRYIVKFRYEDWMQTKVKDYCWRIDR